MSNAITITIGPLAPLVSESVTKTVSLNERVREVKISVIRGIGFSPSDSEKYILTLEGVHLREDQTLGEAGVLDGANLGFANKFQEGPPIRERI